MEPITAAFVFFVTVALGEQNKKQDQIIDSQNKEIVELETKVEELDAVVMRLIGSYSAFAARIKLSDRDQTTKIETLEKDIKILDKVVKYNSY